MRHRSRIVLASALVLTMALANAAAAHPDHGHPDASGELFPGEGVAHGKQHGSDEGHLPPRSDNVQLVGKAEVADRTSDQAGITGRVADVSAMKNHAYLTAFRDPTCEPGTSGVHVIDISDPTAPFEVTEAFVETSAGSYAGEGSQVISMDNEFFSGDLLMFQNEICDDAIAEQSGGITLVDVTDPTNPVKLAEHQGDFDVLGAPFANDVHSAFAWTNDFDGRTYAMLVDNFEFTDVDIMDITDPSNPVLVNDTLDLVELFGVDQDSPTNLTSVFNHDFMVQRVGRRYVANISYWDGGYVLLDVTDPTPGNVSLIAETDYAELDEERLARGHEISPEGNGHQSELSPDNRFLIATDEDFNPFRVISEITSGDSAGTEFIAVNASDTPPVVPDTPVIGGTTFVGLACEPVPAGDGIALIERGVCAFQIKLDNITAAGYDAGIVFNSEGEGCNAFLTMLAAGDIPFVFTDRTTGLRLLGIDAPGDAACTTATPAPGSASADVSLTAVFDGWGYVRIFRTQIPGGVGRPGSIEQIGTYAIPEAQDEAFATGFGDLSIHEVAIDPIPGRRLAYFSYYSGGFRVAEYGDFGLREVGAFIDEGGNNFWGVQVHDIDDEQYVLASDRDFGLYIFQYDPAKPGN